MFGRQARLSGDVIYGTTNTTEQSVDDYARTLRRRTEDAFTLASQYSLRQQLRQKELYDRKVHAKPFEKGEYVWLNSPMEWRGTSKKLHHPWSGQFKVLKGYQILPTGFSSCKEENKGGLSISTD